MQVKGVTPSAPPRPRAAIWLFRRVVALPLLGASIVAGAAEAIYLTYYKMGVWVDHTTNLMWTDRDNGSRLDWNEAIRYCRHLRVNDYIDWRLPEISELRAIQSRGLFYDYRQSPTYQGHIKFSGWKAWSITVGPTADRSYQIEVNPLLATPGVMNYDVHALCVRSADAVPLPNAFDLNSLDENVHAAAEQARLVAADSDAAYKRAERSGNSAYRFSSEAGATTLSEPDGGFYKGEVSGSPGHQYPDGIGELWPSGWRGSDRDNEVYYSGEFLHGKAQGYGVLAVGALTGFPRWVGEIVGGTARGRGELLALDGSTYKGEMPNGYGVIEFGSSQLMYEGETVRGSPHGYGVLWDIRGGVSQQGIWEHGHMKHPSR